MRYYEIPPEEQKKLISSEKASSWQYGMVRIGFYLGVVGVVAFFLAFFYQKGINAVGFNYRTAELYAITVVFIGWITFLIFCRILGISTRSLSYAKLMSILRNEVLVIPDEYRSIRKQIAASLGCMDDRWALYPSIYADDPHKFLPMVVVGPGGVYGMYVSTKNPSKPEFVDPAPGLLLGCEDLSKRLKHEVVPLLVFMRKVKGYETDIPEIRVFATHEMVAYISARETKMDAVELKSLEADLRYMANLGSGVVHQESKFTKHNATESV